MRTKSKVTSRIWSMALAIGFSCAFAMPTFAQEKAGPPGGGIPAKLRPGELSNADQTLLKCATSDELLLIRSLQSSIEGYERESEALQGPYDDAIRKAFDAYHVSDALSEEGSTASEAQKTAALTNAQDLMAEMRVVEARVVARRAELSKQTSEAEKRIRLTLDAIKQRGCPPPAAGKSTTPQIPLPEGAFVMPVLPDCFEDEKDRTALDDKVYRMFLEQIDISSLASTAAARAKARANVDALAALRAKIFSVPLCALKNIGRGGGHAKPPGKKGKKRHAKRAITEDNPLYMEHYQAPPRSRSRPPDSNGSEGGTYAPSPPDDSEPRHPPEQTPDIPYHPEMPSGPQ